jgi:hypothetical protein
MIWSALAGAAAAAYRMMAARVERNVKRMRIFIGTLF